MSILQKLQESIKDYNSSPLVRYLETGQKPEPTARENKLFKISGDPKLSFVTLPNMFSTSQKEKPDKSILQSAERNFKNYLLQTYNSLLPDEQKEFKGRFQTYLENVKTGGEFWKKMHENYLLRQFNTPPLEAFPIKKPTHEEA